MSLEKIAELRDRLEPLSDKARGMRIEAEEWNVLVETLRGILEIDRAQERTVETRLADAFAPRAHEHLGQVGLAWLDPALQQGLAGAGGSAAERAAVARLEKKVDGLARQVERLSGLLEDQGRRLDLSTVEELDRSKKLRDLGGRLAGIGDLETSVTAVNTQLAGLSRNVDAVLELRGRLTDEQGNPIDVAGIRTEVGRLRELRENLTGVDGNLLRLRDFELRVRDVEDALGTGGDGGLDTRFSELSAVLEERLAGRVESRFDALGTELRAETAEAATRLRTELGIRIEQESTRIDRETATRVTRAEERLGASLAERQAASETALRQDLVARTQALVDQRIVALPEQIDRAVQAAERRLETSLRTRIDDRVRVAVDGAVGNVSGNLNRDLVVIRQRLDEVEGGVPEQVDARVAGALEPLSEDLGRGLDARTAALGDDLRTRLRGDVEAAVGELEASLDERVGAAVEPRLAGLDGRVGRAVDTSLANLHEEIRGEVSEQLEEADLPGKVEGALAGVRDELAARIGQAEATLRAERSTAIGDTVQMLRSEVSLSQKAAVREAVQQSQAAMRPELDEIKLSNQKLERRVGQFDTRLERIVVPR